MPDIAEPERTRHFRLRPAHHLGQPGRKLADGPGCAAADVKRPECAARHAAYPLHGRDVRLRHVVDMNEVAKLAAVLEHLRRPPAGQLRPEDRRDSRVGRARRHAGAVDVVVTQRRSHTACGPRP